jgi:hypothetical protein
LLTLTQGHQPPTTTDRPHARQRRGLREALGWGDTQLKVHLGRLASLELIWCQRAVHGAYAYELA